MSKVKACLTATSCMATLERAKDAMDREIEEARENFDKGKVLHDLERLYEFRTEDGYGFTVGIDEMKPL